MELEVIQNKIFEIRGYKVILDFDLALLYNVENKRLKEAVRRNPNRFPEDFMFELSKIEYDSLRTQFATLKNGRGQHLKYLPFAFTEQGIAMLSSVLNSEKAIEVNISIIRAFVTIRQFTLTYSELKDRIIEIEKQFPDIYKALNYLVDKESSSKNNDERNKIGYKN
ncbi:ORF6N domain-containing protein [Flavobacterium rhamnosiphilum]|uniref:ORF6N domain-containing protein n=1 Tax=Flavobacterium rhamnosiphilum TaxID=2541724 RepID=A0A4V2Z9T1_9FLAO|nr:ORF6N domain-containing protein [Flavobacterium rhamnosiphilum]TDE45843.1 ORF6N domain-containing protein [Flavobacterium rhamnosiphilum]